MNTVKQNQVERRKICKKYQWFTWYVCVLSHFSYVQLFVTPWTVAHQAPLSMGFSRQTYQSGLPFPSPGHLPDPGIKTASPALAGGLFVTRAPRKPLIWYPLVLFTQEYIDELSVLRNTLAHKASPDCGLCKRLLRMDQFSLEMVAKKILRETKYHFNFQNSFSFFYCKMCMCDGLLLFSKSIVSNSLRPMD